MDLRPVTKGRPVDLVRLPRLSALRWRRAAGPHVSTCSATRGGGTRRPHIALWQLMATVAVAAVLLWGGALVRDHFWPPPQPPSPPIPDPEFPAGLWYPTSSFFGGTMKTYFNMDDLAKNIRPPRSVVFRLDRAKRRWVRDYREEELIREGPPPRAGGPPFFSPKSTGASQDGSEHRGRTG